MFTNNLAGDKSQDFLCEGDDDTTCKSQETVRTLGRIVALKGETHLDDTPAQENETDCSDQTEDEITEVVDHSQRIVTGSKAVILIP